MGDLKWWRHHEERQDGSTLFLAVGARERSQGRRVASWWELRRLRGEGIPGGRHLVQGQHSEERWAKRDGMAAKVGRENMSSIGLVLIYTST